MCDLVDVTRKSMHHPICSKHNANSFGKHHNTYLYIVRILVLFYSGTASSEAMVFALPWPPLLSLLPHLIHKPLTKEGTKGEE